MIHIQYPGYEMTPLNVHTMLENSVNLQPDEAPQIDLRPVHVKKITGALRAESGRFIRGDTSIRC